VNENTFAAPVGDREDRVPPATDAASVKESGVVKMLAPLRVARVVQLNTVFTGAIVDVHVRMETSGRAVTVMATPGTELPTLSVVCWDARDAEYVNVNDDAVEVAIVKLPLLSAAVSDSTNWLDWANTTVPNRRGMIVHVRLVATVTKAAVHVTLELLSGTAITVVSAVAHAGVPDTWLKMRVGPVWVRSEVAVYVKVNVRSTVTGDRAVIEPTAAEVDSKRAPRLVKAVDSA